MLEGQSVMEDPAQENGIPPMHAANPALAIEHATVEMVALSVSRFYARRTSNFGLTSPFRSRDGTATLEKHTDRLPERSTKNHDRSPAWTHTAAVNKNVLIDFSGSSLTNCQKECVEITYLRKQGSENLNDIFQHGRYHSGRPICWRRDNTPTACVNFIYRDSVAR